MNEKLIGMQAVQEIIQSVLQTAFVENSLPLSILIVAPSGTAKSKNIKQFNGDGIHFQNDLTTFDLNEIFHKDEKQLIHHIVIPDLNLPLSHRASVSKLMIATLLGSTSETIKVYIARKNGREEIRHQAMGLISAITPGVFWKNVNRFAELGFIRRMPPIFYELGENLVDIIMDKIDNDEVSFMQLKETMIAKESEVREKIRIDIPKQFNKEIKATSELFAAHLNTMIQRPSIYKGRVIPSKEPALAPISPHLYLRSLIRGHARLRNRTKISLDDVTFIKRFVSFTNSGNPKSL